MVGVIVEAEVRFTLAELGRACQAEPWQVAELVAEGTLVAVSGAGDDLQFDGTALRRARLALRLARDLQLSAADSAFVVELLEEIDALRAHLRRLGAG